jgi:hypothetical protein
MRMRRWVVLLVTAMMAPTLSGCFTVLGGVIGSAVPRYEDVGAVSAGATVRADTPRGTVHGTVASVHATGFVLRDGDGHRLPLEYRDIAFEKEVGSYAGTGATVGAVVDLCLAAVGLAGLAFLMGSMSSGGFSGW